MFSNVIKWMIKFIKYEEKYKQTVRIPNKENTKSLWCAATNRKVPHTLELEHTLLNKPNQIWLSKRNTNTWRTCASCSLLTWVFPLFWLAVVSVGSNQTPIALFDLKLKW